MSARGHIWRSCWGSTSRCCVYMCCAMSSRGCGSTESLHGRKRLGSNGSHWPSKAGSLRCSSLQGVCRATDRHRLPLPTHDEHQRCGGRGSTTRSRSSSVALRGIAMRTTTLSSSALRARYYSITPKKPCQTVAVGTFVLVRSAVISWKHPWPSSLQ